MISTKHIALAVNEELDLHTRLLVCCTHIALVWQLYLSAALVDLPIKIDLESIEYFCLLLCRVIWIKMLMSQITNFW